MHALNRPFTAILCYDDGSTDDTVAVARALGIEIITGQPNAGVAVARNRLAAAARTEWIHFHDADDLIAPAFVERLMPWCDHDRDVVTCDADWIDEVSRQLVIAWHYDAEQIGRAPFPYLVTHAMGLNSSIIRRSAWDRIGGCDERLKMWEDADIHIRLARDGARFHHVPEVLTWSLRRGESFSHDYRKSWNYRLLALESYAVSAEPAIAPVLAAEAENAASQLLSLGEEASARQAFNLSVRLGANPPTTENPIVRLLKIAVPAYALFRWQCRHRTSQKTSV